ncbi:nucleotidyltransferase domain-containing protein [Pseudoalteromonas luteoviolacea]|uniref:nucleotidyltransferase domain-containing protein n=1 Tax=Pseudoalteromonas luteoviolacea TaxID=43657 RepID=UPI001152052E|nr:nucleotidyltransferase domain-containing protein [Pseudoalteromonas luteoviolacea]TQF68106.1 nucleotidyltransferase domain-containing protein [Pseudoalteromonas luteoviolacea]
MDKAVVSIEPNARTEVMARIKKAEQEHNVKVLYAIESGSRSWGFASPNSDYDVRFIYVHPKDWYLSVMLEDKRDVIEYPITDEIDINGWDLRKALKLLKASNPAIGEWLNSPIVYINEDNFKTQAQALFARYYRTERGLYHYINMAKSNYRGYLKQEKVPLKKYLYVLRALSAAKWIEKYDSPPPIEFSVLVNSVIEDTQLLLEINALVAKKQQATEKSLAPKIIMLNTFIESELSYFEDNIRKSNSHEQDTHHLDAFFRNWLENAFI